jgi:hypothetical protein
MTKEITKANILQEMQDKFKLRELIPEKFSFSEQVIPTYNIEQHLEYRYATFNVVSVTSAAGFLFFTVPANEKWTLNGYNVMFMAAGAYKVSGVYITRVKRMTGAIFYLDLKEGQTVSYAVYLATSIILEAGDTLSILVDDYTSTADLRLYIDYMLEEIR